MDQMAHMGRFSPPLYTGALQLDAYASSVPRPPSSSNTGVYTPSTVLFPPQRSPKGPRPAPSNAHPQNFIEPARIPLPADDVDALQHATTNNTYYYGDVEEGFSNTAEPPRQRTDRLSFDRNIPETLATSLFYGNSASPPPFARDTRTASISSTGSTHHRSHPSIYNAFTSAAATSAPDPWVEQASIAVPPDVIDLESNPIASQDIIQSQALERSTVIGHYDPPALAKGTAGIASGGVGSDQPILVPTTPPVEPAADGAAERVTFSGIYNAVRKAATERKDVDPQVQNSMGIKPSEQQEADDPSNEDPIPSPNSPQNPTEACAQSSLFESLVPPPFSIATSVPVPIITSTGNKTMPSNATSSSNSTKSSILVGSSDSTHMPLHHLAESAAWEKIEGINDEWQELSNPREDVLAMSESEDSELEDDDDEEWEASRKLNTMADSAFLPSVERRRRLAAAAAQLKKQDADVAGAATPRGKRSPTTSIAHAHGKPVRAKTPSSTSKLTPQQEQLVAELQRARTTRGIAMPLHQHQQMNRRVVPLSSDW